MTWTINETNEFKKGLKKYRKDASVLKGYKRFLSDLQQAFRREADTGKPFYEFMGTKDKGLRGWRNDRTDGHYRRHRLAGGARFNVVYQVLKSDQVLVFHCIGTHQACDLGESLEE